MQRHIARLCSIKPYGFLCSDTFMASSQCDTTGFVPQTQSIDCVVAARLSSLGSNQPTNKSLFVLTDRRDCCCARGHFDLLGAKKRSQNLEEEQPRAELWDWLSLPRKTLNSKIHGSMLSRQIHRTIRPSATTLSRSSHAAPRRSTSADCSNILLLLYHTFIKTVCDP